MEILTLEKQLELKNYIDDFVKTNAPAGTALGYLAVVLQLDIEKPAAVVYRNMSDAQAVEVANALSNTFSARSAPVTASAEITKEATHE